MSKCIGAFAARSTSCSGSLARGFPSFGAGMSEEHEGGIYPAPTDSIVWLPVGTAYMPPASYTAANGFFDTAIIINRRNGQARSAC